MFSLEMEGFLFDFRGAFCCVMESRSLASSCSEENKNFSITYRITKSLPSFCMRGLHKVFYLRRSSQSSSSWWFPQHYCFTVIISTVSIDRQDRLIGVVMMYIYLRYFAAFSSQSPDWTTVPPCFLSWSHIRKRKWNWKKVFILQPLSRPRVVRIIFLVAPTAHKTEESPFCR